MITDEMVEKAAKAMNDSEGLIWTSFKVLSRAALEAVAPMLIAQGLRKAVELSGEGWTIEYILDQAKALDHGNL